ncbi:TPA: Mor transcription activator family protein, partial [Pseudomonas aeruginosa]
MSRSEVDLREVQDMLPDTVRDMAGRIGLPATLVVVE